MGDGVIKGCFLHRVDDWLRTVYYQVPSSVGRVDPVEF